MSENKSLIMRSGHFRAKDQTKLFYSIEGNPDGENLVFCYGLICSISHWKHQIEFLKKKYKIYWMDYRGHHASDLPKNLDTISLPSIVEDLNTFFNEVKINKATIIGHSMGVNVALEFYKKYPDKVTALILANGTPHRPLETLLLNNLCEPLFKFLKWAENKQPYLIKLLWHSQKMNPLVYEIISKLGFNESYASKDDIQNYIKQFSSLDPKIFIKLIENYNDYDCTTWLHTIVVPTLIIAGEKDYITPIEKQQLLHQLILKSELYVVKKGSHCPHIDFPELISTKIQSFLSEIIP